MSLTISGDTPNFNAATITTGTVTTLTTTTISDGTNSTSATNCIQGSAKAWICFKLDTTPTIRASYNVSSVTYVSTGIANVNFTNAMSDTNYAVTTTGFIDYTGSYYRFTAREINGTISTTYFQIRTDPNIGLFNGVDYIGCAVFR